MVNFRVTGMFALTSALREAVLSSTCFSFQIAKYSTKFTFLEDVGLKPEDAYRIDTKGNKEYLKFKDLPINETAAYRHRWKREVLANVGGRRLRPSVVREVSNDVRFFSKSFQRSFNKHGEFFQI